MSVQMHIIVDRSATVVAPARQPAMPEVEYWRRAVESDHVPRERLPEPPPGFGLTADVQVVDHAPVLCASCFGPTSGGECLHPGCRDGYLAEVAPPHAVGWSS